MDPDDFDLIARLCTKAGMMMEDASVIAITASGCRPDDVRATLAKLEKASDTIAALVRAAGAVAREAG